MELEFVDFRADFYPNFAKSCRIKNNSQIFAHGNIQITHLHDQNGIAAFTRGDGKYLIVLNFRGNRWLSYNVAISGFYKELANTSWPQFNLSGQQEVSRQGYQHHNINEVPIPAYGVVVLEKY